MTIWLAPPDRGADVPRQRFINCCGSNDRVGLENHEKQ
jgi:hypothetical protein